MILGYGKLKMVCPCIKISKVVDTILIRSSLSYIGCTFVEFNYDTLDTILSIILNTIVIIIIPYPIADTGFGEVDPHIPMLLIGTRSQVGSDTLPTTVSVTIFGIITTLILFCDLIPPWQRRCIKLHIVLTWCDVTKMVASITGSVGLFDKVIVLII